MSEPYLTIQGDVTVEVIIKKSRFICQLKKLTNEQDAIDFIELSITNIVKPPIIVLLTKLATAMKSNVKVTMVNQAARLAFLFWKSCKKIISIMWPPSSRGTLVALNLVLVV